MIFGAFRTAMTALGVNKMRSVLSVLGIVIGVSAVTVMIAMGRSVQNQISNSIGRLGVNAVFVYPKMRRTAGGAVRNVESQRLTLEDSFIDLVQKENARTPTP